MAEMTSRSIRVPDDVWSAAMDRAAEQDVKVSDVLRDSLAAFAAAPCDECGDCAVCGGEQFATETVEVGETATIYGYGRFSETSNPEVQAVIDRAKELLAEGAVGVSVATDLNPADMPLNPDDIDETTIENAQQRVRHVAIVDTPAFNGAYLDLAADGVSVEGPMVFEGIPTGDGRAIGPVGTFLIDETQERIPIIFDISEGDHTAMVVGYIDRYERRDGINTGVAPITASVDAYPAHLFSEPEPTPMTVHPADAQGYRRYSGIAMGANICHKGGGACYKYKHKGFSLDYFHSGARVPLDDGTVTRVGPIMFGDLHADGTVMDYSTALQRTNEDARTVFAMGRMFHHPKGLLFSGVLMPDADIMRVQATAPSVEIWPDDRGRAELKTTLNVPRPALPVVAALPGGGIQSTDAEPVVVEDDTDEYFTRMATFNERLERVEKATAELFAAHLANTL